MGIIKRQSLKASIVNYAGVLIGVVFFNFVFPHLISEEYVGLINLLQTLTYFLVALPSLGLAHVLLRFYGSWKDKDMVRQFNAFALILIAIGLLLFSTGYILAKEPVISYYKTKSALFIPYYFLVIPMVVIQAFSQYFEVFAMLKLRVAVPAFLREIVTRILLISLVFLFVYQWVSEMQFIYGIVGVYLITFLILLFYTVKGLQFKIAHPAAFIQKNKQLKSQMYYSGGMLLLMVCNNVHNFLDGILVSAYLGIGALGIYGRPLVLGQMIQVPYRAISLIAIPIIREAIVENNMKKVYELNKSIGINLFLIGCFLFSLLIVNADGIFSLLPSSYEAGRDVLYIIAFGRLLDMGFGLNSEILNYSKYYKYIIISSLIMVLSTIALNILLIPKMGMSGAAVAVSVSLILFNILKSWVIWQKFHFHCFSKHYITLICISTGVLFILHFVPVIQFVNHHMFMNSCFNILFKSVMAASLFIASAYYFEVSPDLNSFIKLVRSGKIFKGGYKMNEL